MEIPENLDELWDKLVKNSRIIPKNGVGVYRALKESRKRLKAERRLAKELRLSMVEQSKPQMSHFESRYVERVGLKPNLDEIRSKIKNYELKYICKDGHCELYEYPHPYAPNRKYVIVYDSLHHSLVTIRPQCKYDSHRQDHRSNYRPDNVRGNLIEKYC